MINLKLPISEKQREIIYFLINNNATHVYSMENNYYIYELNKINTDIIKQLDSFNFLDYSEYEDFTLFQSNSVPIRIEIDDIVLID